MFFTLILILVLFITALLFYARWNYGTLEGLGFPVMKPSLFLGSDPDLHKNVAHLEDIKRQKKYGPVWGFYQGRTPIVYLADPEIIKSIWVKDSLTHFYNRAPREFGDPIINEILDYLQDEKWKFLRNTQSKVFSVTKLKQRNTNVFNQAMDSFLAKMDTEIKKSGKNRIQIDARDRLCTYVLDANARTLFSMKVDSDEDAHFIEACKKIIGEGQIITKFYVWTLTFPWLSRFAPTLVLDRTVTDKFLDIVASRNKTGKKYNDYGDILTHCFNQLSSTEYKNLGITKNTLLGQATNLYLAGFDGPSGLIACLAYNLALEPKIQDRILAEIRTVMGPDFDPEKDATIDYENLQKMDYLNACVLETARMYPILIRPERVCNEDWEDRERGIRIPKGTVVTAAPWAVNRDPQYYENPNEFMPERFLAENKTELNPYAFLTFGFGHRGCIAQRFAYELIKVFAARLLLQYRLELRNDSNLDFRTGLVFILQLEPVLLDILPRKPGKL